MSYSLATLDRLTQKFVRSGTSLFIRTFDDSTLVNEFEFTGLVAGAPIPVEVMETARAIRTDIARGTALISTANNNTVLLGVGGGVHPLLSSLEKTEPLVILIGDSITAQCWSQVTFNATTGLNEAILPEGYDTSLSGYAEVANAILGLPFRFLNAAQSGQETPWMATNLALVIANHPEASEVWFHGGVNDIDGGATDDDQIVTNTLACCDMALAAGMRFVWSSTVMAAASHGWTTAKRNTLARANARIRAALATRNMVDIVDSCGRLLDTADANGWTSASYLYDGLHPSGNGALAWGKLLADKIAYRCPTIIGGVEHPAQAFAVDSTQFQLVADPLHLGTTGASAGTGVSGTQIAALTIGRTSGGASDVAVASVTNSPDGVGKAQKLVVTAGTGACAFRVLDAVNNPGIAGLAGHTYRFEFYAKCSALTNFRSLELEALGSVTSVSTPTPSVYALGEGATPDGIDYADAITLRVAIDLTMPSDMTAFAYLRHNIKINFNGIGGGTFEIYRRSCTRIS